MKMEVCVCVCAHACVCERHLQRVKRRSVKLMRRILRWRQIASTRRRRLLDRWTLQMRWSACSVSCECHPVHKPANMLTGFSMHLFFTIYIGLFQVWQNHFSHWSHSSSSMSSGPSAHQYLLLNVSILYISIYLKGIGCTKGLVIYDIFFHPNYGFPSLATLLGTFIQLSSQPNHVAATQCIK